MFGILYTGIVGICKAVVGLQDSMENGRRYEKAKSQGDLTYFDSLGCERLISSGEPVFFCKLSNGDRVLKNNRGQIVHNYDIERKKERICERQKILDEENPDVILCGALEDVFPHLVRKNQSIYEALYGKEAVYLYVPDNKYYLRERIFGAQMPKYCFTDLSTGYPTYLYQEVSEYAQERLDAKLASWKDESRKKYMFIKSKGLDTL